LTLGYCEMWRNITCLIIEPIELRKSENIIIIIIVHNFRGHVNGLIYSALGVVVGVCGFKATQVKEESDV